MRCAVCLEPVAMPTKYRNEPVRSKHDGRLFQSKREYRRQPALIAEQNAGFITDLRYQVPFRLELYSTQAVDALLEWLEKNAGAVLGRFSCFPLVNDLRRSRQRVCVYVADFTYLRDGRLVVEDPKGKRSPVYSIKRKLMVLAHNIEIIEPTEGGVQQRARGAGVHGVATGSRFKGGR